MILYHDDEIMVINKPSGVATQGIYLLYMFIIINLKKFDYFTQNLNDNS